ncbi:MAG: hypothetical protein AAGA97_05255 [Pseudomonadota bacterium]
MKDENGLTYLDHDEHMRPEADIQTLGALMPSFEMMGEFTGFGDLAIQRFPELERINTDTTPVTPWASSTMHRRLHLGLEVDGHHERSAGH